MSKATIIPFGPQHPVLPEPIHLDLVVEDETVVEDELPSVEDDEIAEGDEIVEDEVGEDEVAQPVPFEGEVEVVLLNEETIYFGDTVVLYAAVTGANTEYQLRWECKEVDDLEWTVIEDETEEYFSFVVDEENAVLEYRVVVITEA
jgi:hypothetical protein